MKLKKLHVWDDMPLGAVVPYSGMSYYTSSASYNPSLVALNDQRWLNGTVNIHYLSWPLLSQNLDMVGKTVFGAKITVTNNAIFRVFELYSFTSSAPLTRIVPSACGIPINTITYVEMVIDWVALTQSLYVNGNPTPAFTVQYTAAQMASIKTNYQYVILGGGGGSTAYNFWYKDITIREYDIGETYVPLKSPRFNAVVLKNVFATGYQTSDASNDPGLVLNTPFTDLSTSLSAPTIDSVNTLTLLPIKADLSLPNCAPGTIVGMELFDTAKSTETPAGSYIPKLTQNGQDLLGQTFSLTAAMQYRKGLFGGLTTAPDGSSWSRTKINTSKLTLAAITG